SMHASEAATKCSFSERNPASNPKMALQKFRLRLDFVRRALVHDMPVVDNVDTLRQGQHRREVLLHQHDGLTGGGEIATSSHQIAHNYGREPFEWLIQQNDLGIPN